MSSLFSSMGTKRAPNFLKADIVYILQLQFTYILTFCHTVNHLFFLHCTHIILSGSHKNNIWVPRVEHIYIPMRTPSEPYVTSRRGDRIPIHLIPQMNRLILRPEIGAGSLIQRLPGRILGHVASIVGFTSKDKDRGAVRFETASKIDVVAGVELRSDLVSTRRSVATIHGREDSFGLVSRTNKERDHIKQTGIRSPPTTLHPT